MEFETLQPGYILMPHFYLWNEEGVSIMGAIDLNPAVAAEAPARGAVRDDRLDSAEPSG